MSLYCVSRKILITAMLLYNKPNHLQTPYKGVARPLWENAVREAGTLIGKLGENFSNIKRPKLGKPKSKPISCNKEKDTLRDFQEYHNTFAYVDTIIVETSKFERNGNPKFSQIQVGCLLYGFNSRGGTGKFFLPLNLIASEYIFFVLPSP